MNSSENKIPTWFWVVAGIAVLWNLMGLYSFYYHMSMTGEALADLPLNEKELYESYPLWTKIVFAIATFAGLAGSIALVLKKAVAKPIFLISLVAIFIQMTHSLYFTTSIEVYGPTTPIMPSLLIAIAAFLVWFSKFSISKNWIN